MMRAMVATGCVLTGLGVAALLLGVGLPWWLSGAVGALAAWAGWRNLTAGG